MLRRLASLGLLVACVAEADLGCVAGAEGAQCAADEASLIQLKQVDAGSQALGQQVAAPFAGYTSEGWTTKLWMNCYPGFGADTMLGGPYGETPAVGSVSAAAVCQAVCDQTEGCEGIVMCTAADGNCGQPNVKADSTCWLIKNVVVSRCAWRLPSYSTWLSPRVKNRDAELTAANFNTAGSAYAVLPEGWCTNTMSAGPSPSTCKRDYHADWKNFQWICVRPQGNGVRKDFCDSFCSSCNTVFEGAGSAVPTPAPQDDSMAKCKQRRCYTYDCTLPRGGTCYVWQCGSSFCSADCGRCSGNMLSVAPSGANFR